MLPVSGSATELTSLLVATLSGLAIVTADKDPGSGHRSTRWEPWDAVRFSDEGEAAPDAPAQYDGYAVHIGGLTFPCPTGRSGGRASPARLRDRRTGSTCGPGPVGPGCSRMEPSGGSVNRPAGGTSRFIVTRAGAGIPPSGKSVTPTDRLSPWERRSLNR